MELILQSPVKVLLIYMYITLCMYVCAPLSLSMALSMQSLLSDEQISSCPVLILGNKIDKNGACSEEDIKSFFGLHQQLTGKVCMSVCTYIHK